MSKKPKTENIPAAETTPVAPVVPVVTEVAAPKPKEEAMVRTQRFSNINRIEHFLGNLIVRTNATRQMGDKQAGIRDTIIPLHKVQAKLDNWRQVRDALARNGDQGWIELGEIIEQFEARVKEALAYRHKHNVDPNAPYL